MELSNNEIRNRYSRHISLPEIGLEGQRKLLNSSVLCIGAGGLGSPVALYLAAAGVGKIGIADFDSIELSNLQRQILHATEDVGTSKTASAAKSILRLNPHVQVSEHNTRLSRENALDIIRPYDVVVDGTDNFPTRYLANDACVLLKKTYIYGSISRFDGQASVFAPHLGGPCYRCLFPEPPPPGTVANCAEGGVLGVLPGVIGVIQATETIKLLLGIGRSLVGRLLLYEALNLSFREIKCRRDPRCPICGDNPSILELPDYQIHCNANMQTPSLNPDEVTIHDMKSALDNPSLGIQVIDVREANEHAASRVSGTVLIPLSELPNRCGELDPKREYYLHCKGGVRSLKAVAILKEKGIKNAKSVAGGIQAWIEDKYPCITS